MPELLEMKTTSEPNNGDPNELKNRSKKNSITKNDNEMKIAISNNSDDDNDLESIDMTINLYETIFNIMIPYVIVGCPFNYCFDRKKNSCINSITMKIYTFIISIFVHILVIFWFTRLLYNLFSRKHLTNEIIEDIFIFSYVLAGVIGLNLIWIYRKSIANVLKLLDINPINERCQTLLAQRSFRLKWNKWKFYFLIFVSYINATLIIFYYGYLIYNAIDIYRNQNHEVIRWLRTMRFITIYALYFFIADAFLLLALIWSLKFRIIHLNLFIKNLIKIEDVPEIDDIEIIKLWFQNILKITKKIDNSFSFYMPVFIGFLFFGIIYFLSQTINIVKSGVEGETIEFLSTMCLSFLMSLILFYVLKELSDVHQLSSMTKSILYDYVLDTKPHDRTTKFYEEIHFIANGLLSNPATFTLLGQIELNRSFLVRLIMVIYSYTIIFNQFERQIPNESTS